MRIVVIVSFLNEEDYLPELLGSMARQTRFPDDLLLVDDGSTDASGEIAGSFARQHGFARVLTRPPRPRTRDRLASAPEWRSFLWAAEQVHEPYDVIAKMDADLRLTPPVFEEIERHFGADAGLGMAGFYLSVLENGGRRRERNPAYHVRGPTKFYRRECLEQIMPVLAVPGWETIDEVKARMLGWRTASFEAPGGDPIHLRPTGSLDGRLRGFRRDGQGAWSYGAHPLHIALGAVNRMRDRPRGLGAANYVAGWAVAAVRRVPRAEPEVRAHARREQLLRIRTILSEQRLP